MVAPFQRACLHVAQPEPLRDLGWTRCGEDDCPRRTGETRFPHAPEVARQIIRQQVEASGTALPWGDKAAYTDLTDRGVPDTLGYSRLIGRYTPMVFVAPPWQEIYETDGERKQDFAEAECTYQTVVEVYRECGYQIVDLPRTTPCARAQFILAAIATRT